MRIMIVEDDAQVSDFLKSAVEARGHEDIDLAWSGEDAVAKSVNQNSNLITLDIKMPGVSGLDIISLLRNLNPHAIIAIISGHIPEELSSDVTASVDVIMGKPIEVDRLHQLLDRSQLISSTLMEINDMGDVALEQPR